MRSVFLSVALRAGRVVVIALALWACGVGSARAGDGESVGSVQTLLGNADGTTGLCHLLAINPCPQLPTLTQLVLQFAAVVNTPPNLIRSPQGAGLIGGAGICTQAGTESLAPCDTVAINAVNPTVPSASLPMSTAAPDLSSLSSLPFIAGAGSSGQAVPVPLGDNANSFLYAVATTASGTPGQPDSLTLTYDYLPLRTTTFVKGQQVAAIALPLAFLDGSGAEDSVTTILQISAACTGGTSCLTATAVGNFSGNGIQKRAPSDLGLTWRLVFAPSPNSPQSAHAIFQVQAPLVVTRATDAAYFGVVPFGATTDGINPSSDIGQPTFVNQLSGLPTAFTKDDTGFATAFLKGVSDGIAPYAAPQTRGIGQTSLYGFCASFWAGNPTNLTLNAAVAAFLSIATDGTSYLSSPVPPPATLACPS